MLLSAVLLAAVVQAVPVGPVPDAAPPARIEDGRVIRPLKKGCSLGEVTPAETSKGEDSAHPLSKEPRSGLRYAVMRSVDGCPVDAPMVVNRRK